MRDLTDAGGVREREDRRRDRRHLDADRGPARRRPSASSRWPARPRPPAHGRRARRRGAGPCRRPRPAARPRCPTRPRPTAGRRRLASASGRRAATRGRGRAGGALPIVAIVGRPNVGKSTLFNRILGSRTAIVEDRARTTRDRLYGDAEWNGRRFVVVDTGGLEVDPDDPIEARVQEQARLAIAEADVILFVVDADDGPDTGRPRGSRASCAAPRRRSSWPSTRPTTRSASSRRAEFHALGWEETLRDLREPRPRHRRPARRDRLGAAAREPSRSSPARRARPRPRRGPMRSPRAGSSRSSSVIPRPATADGTRRGRDSTASMPRRPRWDAAIAAEADTSPPRSRSSVARTSASRASLNALLGEDRAIVSEIPGRPATPSTRAWRGAAARSCSIDTAGIRRRGKVACGPAAETLLDAARAARAVACRRRGPRRRCRRGPDLAGRPRRGLRRRGGQGPGHRGQQVGPRRRQDRQDVRPVRRVDPQRGRRSSTSRRSCRSAPRPASGSGACSRPRSTSGRERRRRISTGELNRVLMAATDRTPPPPVRGQPAEALLRDPGGRSRRRRSCSSRRTRRRSTSRTGATSRTGCARRSGSTARRSGSCSAIAPRSSCRVAGRLRSAAGGPAKGRRPSAPLSEVGRPELMDDAPSASRSSERGRGARPLARDRRQAWSRSRCSPLHGDGRRRDQRRRGRNEARLPGIDLPAALDGDRRSGDARRRRSTS